METNDHKLIKNAAYQYLLNQGYRLARMEKVCDYHGVADAWGINFQTFYTKIIEVKISRADFCKDKCKMHRASWHPAAEEFYYVCPSGLIQPDEVGETCGLLWFNGKRLINKKKAPILKVHISTKMRILIDFLEVNSPGGYERKSTLKIN